MAFEYSLTKNWVPVFEALYVNSSASSFVGNPGLTPGGIVGSIGGTGGSQFSLAPALEYNFSANLGVIGGVWFPVGNTSGGFTAYTLAINYFF